MPNLQAAGGYPASSDSLPLGDPALYLQIDRGLFESKRENMILFKCYLIV